MLLQGQRHGEMAAGPQPDADRHSGQVLDRADGRIRRNEDGVAGDTKSAGAELAHAGAGVGYAAPGAGVGDGTLALDHGLVLRTALVSLGLVAVDVLDGV